METCIALLRGINVSGHNMIKMEELREAMAKLGFSDIITYIQSGNVLFSCKPLPHAELETLIAAMILERFSCRVPVVVRTAGELKSVLENNPFITSRNLDPEKMHVTFLAGLPAPERLEAISAISFPPDEFAVRGKDVYLYCPDGYGRTKLTPQFFESKLKVVTTTRNWKTVGKLAEMAIDK